MSQTPGGANTHQRINSQLNNYDIQNMTPTNIKKSINERLLASNKSTNKSIPNSQNNLSNSQNLQNSTNNNCNKPATNTKSFAETTAIINFPDMNQAIILPIIEGIKQIDYVIAIGKLIGPSNIISASRISNDRFCIFLASHTIADNIVRLHQNILINEHTVSIRKLINPSKRIILSNVYPSIPHNTICTALNELGIRTTSNITFLKAGFNISELAHITSFRRQVYINPEDYVKLPPSLVINLNNTNFRIFLTDDTVTCFICKQNGHLSSACKNIQDKCTYYPTTNTEENTSIDSSIITTNIEIDPVDIVDADIVLDTDKNPIGTFKRPLTVTTSGPSSPTLSSPMSPKISEPSITRPKNIKDNQPTKKPKIRSRSNSSTRIDTCINETLDPARDILLKNDEKYINFNTFKYIIENALEENTNIRELCKQSDVTLKTLSDTIDIIHPLVKDKRLNQDSQEYQIYYFKSSTPTKKT